MLDLDTVVRQKAEEELRAATVLWLGTVRPDGSPHMVPVWFSWDGEAVLILTRPTDQKVKNLRHSPKVTLGIARDPDRGVVILAGEAELLERPSAEIAPPAYPAKYRALMDANGWNWDEIIQEVSQPIRVRPTKVDAW